MLQVNGIKDVTTTVKNPQANAICERFHQSISNMLRTMLHTYPPNNIDQINDIMDTCFATAAYASKVFSSHIKHITWSISIPKRYGIKHTSYYRFTTST